MIRILTFVVAALAASTSTALVPLRAGALWRSSSVRHSPAALSTTGTATFPVPIRTSVVVEAGDEYAAAEAALGFLKVLGPFALAIVFVDETSVSSVVKSRPR